MKLNDGCFLITGGASGLGAACARHFAGQGASVVIADLDIAAGEKLAAELGSKARFVRTDVTSTDDAQAAIETATREFAAIRVLAQCAGILGASRIVGKKGPHDLALFERVVRINLVGTFNMLRLVAEAMSKNSPDPDGQRGVIVNTSSVAAFDGQLGQAAYSASKGGVASLTLPAARELARFGVRVAAVAPGVFDTAMMAGTTDELRDSLASQIPFPSRFGKPEEFAQLVQAIVENVYVNGEVIRLDGALRMGAK
jgi:NAD(P)-dependent dehydrogenase (short-subunit alcohol dehydrogenase family)